MKNIFITSKSLTLCIIFALLGTGCSGCFGPTPEEEKQAERESEVEKLRLTFFKNEGNEIRLAWEELDVTEIEWLERTMKLMTICRHIGRNPNLDEDFLLWTERLEQLARDRERLNSMADDAFLAYAKFTLALDPVSEGRYQEALQEGLVVAAELRARYKALRELKMSVGSH